MHPWITAVKWTLKSYLNMSQGKDYRSVVQDKLYFKCNVILYIHMTNVSFTFDSANLSTKNVIYEFIFNKAKHYQAKLHYKPTYLYCKV